MALSITLRPRRARAFPIASLAVAAAAGLCACGDVGGAAPDMAPPPPDLVLADLKAPGYPAGPTGPNVGDVVPDFTFQGYFSPTRTTGLASSEPFGEVSFDMLRTVAGARYAIVQTAASWCGPCLLNARVLATKGAPLVSRGVLLGLVLTDGVRPGRAAVKRELDQWIENVPQYFTSFLDSVAPQPPMQEFFAVERDHFLLIDLATMTLVDIVAGDPQTALDEATSLLP